MSARIVPGSFRRSLVLVIALVLVTWAAGAAIDARDAQAPAGSPVTLDFRVVSEDGTPIADLKPEEIALRVGGREKKVASLRLIDLVGGGKPAAGGAAAVVLPPPFATNASTAAGRNMLIIIDDESVPPGREQPVREAVGQILSGLTPRDQVGLIAMPRTGQLVSPTHQTASVTAAMEKIAGKRRLSGDDILCRTRDTLDAMKALSQGLSGGAATTVVFVSFSIAAPGSSGGTCPVSTSTFQETAYALSGSRANFFVVHIMDGGSDNPGLNNLASTTSSELIRYTGQNLPALGRITRETSSYYVLAFDAETADRTGQSQRIELRVAGRQNARVRVRSEMSIPKGAGGLTPKDMVREVKAFQDLALRANAYLSRNVGDDKLKTLVLFEPAEPGVTLTSAMAVLFDDKGKGVAQWTGQAADLARAPIVAAPGPPLPSGGTYRLRVAATDSNGRAGAVDTDVRVELVTAGAVRFSTMVLGLVEKNAFVPRLQFGPADTAAVGYIEVYGVADPKTLSATYELADSMDGAAMATGQGSLAQGKESIIITGGFGIGPLQPGDYIFRAIIKVDGKEIGRTVRTVRKAAQ